MEMWELKLSQKRKTKSSFLSLSLSLCQVPLLAHVLSFEMTSIASTSVLLDFHKGWDTILEFSKTLLASLAENNWSYFILFLLEEETGWFRNWLLFFYLSAALPSFQVLLESRLWADFWLCGALVIHQSCKFLSLNLGCFCIFLCRQFYQLTVWVS